MAELIDGYRQSLFAYVERREGLRAKPARSPVIKSLVSEAVQRLNDLDVRREVAKAGAATSAGARRD